MSPARRSAPEPVSSFVFTATPIRGTDVMAKKSNRPRELEILGEKVREAKELIGQLRESNRALAAELAELKSRLGGVESEKSEATSSPPHRQSKSGKPSQLELLQRERKEIREKVSHLLQTLEGNSSSSSAG